jgi:hypothetical protein
MKKKDLKKMTDDEKKAMRKASAKIMGERIIYEENLRKLKEINNKEEEPTE